MIKNISKLLLTFLLLAGFAHVDAQQGPKEPTPEVLLSVMLEPLLNALDESGVLRSQLLAELRAQLADPAYQFSAKVKTILLKHNVVNQSGLLNNPVMLNFFLSTPAVVQQYGLDS